MENMQRDTSAERKITLLVLFNHALTQEQLDEARTTLRVGRCIEPSAAVQQIWGQVPPWPDSLQQYLQPVRYWLSANAQKRDYVLIQGDFGATYLMVRFCLKNSLVPIYSTTLRRAVEQRGPDGTVALAHLFKHCRFRKYGV